MRAWALVLSLLVMLTAPGSAEAGQRVALVIGNGAYKNVGRLPNAPLSAQAMSIFLQGAGFDVMLGIDLPHGKMAQKLAEFGTKSKGADLAVLYYAGRVFTVDAGNYLLPVDDNIRSRADIKLGAGIDLELTLRETMGEATVKLAFLDASGEHALANNRQSLEPPFGAAEMGVGEDTLTVFAAGYQSAPDGPPGVVRPLARALIANITVPGVDIREAMSKVRAAVSAETNGEQVPEMRISTTLKTEVYLNPVAPANDR